MSGIKAKCDGCGDPIKKKAALLFGVPKGKKKQKARKRHLCRGCYKAVVRFVSELDTLLRLGR